MAVNLNAYSASLLPVTQARPGDRRIIRYVNASDTTEEVIVRPVPNGFTAYDSNGQEVTLTAAEMITALGAVSDDTLALVFGGEALTNSSGNTTLTIPVGRRHHIAVITFSGAARTSEIIIPVTGRVAYDVVRIRLVNVALTDVVQRFRNATAGGTILDTESSNNGIGCFDFYFDGAAFKPLTYAQPVV